MRKNVVQMKQIVEKMNLKNLTPDVELSDKVVSVPSAFVTTISYLKIRPFALFCLGRQESLLIV